MTLSSGFLTDKTCFIATGKNLDYILYILNSIIGKYMCYHYVSILDDGGFLMQKIYLEKFPLIPFDKGIDKKFIEISNSIRTDEEKEKLINEIVCEFYGFNDEEIKFIEAQ